jgi:hypothetical protein
MSTISNKEQFFEARDEGEQGMKLVIAGESRRRERKGLQSTL